MRRILLVTVLLLLVAMSALAAARNITSGEARNMLAKNKNIYLLDVRTPAEFSQAHLKGAVLISLRDLQLRYSEIPRDRPVIVYCAVGSRSASAVSLLDSKGYKDVYNMTDGIMGWYRSGFPIER